MVKRRQILIAGAIVGGGLVLGANMLPTNRRRDVVGYVTKENEHLVTTWLKIGNDDFVTVYIPHAEFGQGTSTGLAMILAEELGADWEKIRVERAPALTEFSNYAFIESLMAGFPIPKALNQVKKFTSIKVAETMRLQLTGGSTAMRFTGHFGMRVQGAAAREMLKLAAADTWAVEVSEITVEKGIVRHQASDRSTGFGSLAEMAARYEPPLEPKFKDPKRYTIVGQPLQTFDIEEKVKGSLIYGIDVAIPKMKYAAVKASPTVGGEVLNFDEHAIAGRTGYIKTVVISGAIAVVADSWWQAQQAIDNLPVTFSEGPFSKYSSEQVINEQFAMLDRATNDDDDESLSDVVIDKGDVVALPGQKLSADYQVPFETHAPLEPMNCIVQWHKNRKIETWIGLRNPLATRVAMARHFDIEESDIIFHNSEIGGSFGTRSVGMENYFIQCVEIAQQFEFPIKLIWSREQDIQNGYYRPAVAARLTGTLDDDGTAIGWQSDYFYKDTAIQASPAEIPYSIPNQRMRALAHEPPIRFGSWRSVNHSQQCFFKEAFIDELAGQGGHDPLAYRRKLVIGQPRLVAVLDRLEKLSDWHQPKLSRQGIGMALSDVYGSFLALAIHVDVTEAGVVHVNRVDCVIDCGLVINPDSVKAQLEGGIVWGLTAALHPSITVSAGRVQQSNYHDYQVLRMHECPEINIALIDSFDAPGGVGEASVPAVAPALVNAIHNAIGLRVRHLPVQDISELLGSRHA